MSLPSSERSSSRWLIWPPVWSLETLIDISCDWPFERGTTQLPNDFPHFVLIGTDLCGVSLLDQWVLWRPRHQPLLFLVFLVTVCLQSIWLFMESFRYGFPVIGKKKCLFFFLDGTVGIIFLLYDRIDSVVVIWFDLLQCPWNHMAHIHLWTFGH